MRVWIGTLCIFILLSLAAASPQAPPATASIEGVLTRADNGQPIAGAQATINLTGIGAPTTSTPAAPVITTDTDGKFHFKNLAPGAYRLIATAPDFVRQEYGQRSIVSGLGGTPIELTSGQSMKNASIRLTATGTVSGRILDDRGQPAIEVTVLVLQHAYDSVGSKTLRQIAAGNTNNRGEYRVYGVPPGRYFLAMGNGPGNLRLVPFNQPPLINYVLKYFPGVTDFSQASLLEIRPGGELVADMTAERQKLFAIRGRVIDSTGQILQASALKPGQEVRLSKIVTGFDRSITYSGGPLYDPATGSFELLNMIPGAYTIRAELGSSNYQAQATAAGMDKQSAMAARPIADLAIVIQDSNLENLVLTIATPVSVPGTLSIEGHALSDVPGSNRTRLRFQKYVNGSADKVGDPPQPQPAGPDGKFQVVGMHAAEYSVYIFGVPPTLYVKSATFDGNDILGKRLKFDGTSRGEFSIVLSSKPGQVSGTVIDEKIQPVPAIQAVLVPDTNRGRSDLYRNIVTDMNGRFAFAGIAPGNYKLFAWDGLEPYRYFDEEFMKKYEAKGRSILVGESDNTTADIPMIPLSPE